MMKLFKRSGFLTALFLFTNLLSCSNNQGGGTGNINPNPPQPPSPTQCASCGGTMTATLSSAASRNIGFTVTPVCKAPTDYLICYVDILNNSNPSFASPLVHTWRRADTCENYDLSPFNITGIDCEYSCTGSSCVWITINCVNTTTGTSLTIDSMPPNVTCSAV